MKCSLWEREPRSTFAPVCWSPHVFCQNDGKLPARKKFTKMGRNQLDLKQDWSWCRDKLVFEKNHRGKNPWSQRSPSSHCLYLWIVINHLFYDKCCPKSYEEKRDTLYALRRLTELLVTRHSLDVHTQGLGCGSADVVQDLPSILEVLSSVTGTAENLACWLVHAWKPSLRKQRREDQKF